MHLDVNKKARVHTMLLRQKLAFGIFSLVINLTLK